MVKTMSSAEKQNCNVTEQIIGDKKYVVKSVFVGNKDVKTILLKLAERKVIREMGLDS